MKVRVNLPVEELKKPIILEFDVVPCVGDEITIITGKSTAMDEDFYKVTARDFVFDGKRRFIRIWTDYL